MTSDGTPRFDVITCPMLTMDAEVPSAADDFMPRPLSHGGKIPWGGPSEASVETGRRGTAVFSGRPDKRTERCKAMADATWTTESDALTGAKPPVQPAQVRVWVWTGEAIAPFAYY